MTLIGGRDERDEVDRALQSGELGEALLEGNGEQEGEEDLHARLGDTQLLELLVEVAVEPLRLGLVSLVRHRTSCPTRATHEAQGRDAGSQLSGIRKTDGARHPEGCRARITSSGPTGKRDGPRLTARRNAP